jgi:hypothetical protein
MPRFLTTVVASKSGCARLTAASAGLEADRVLGRRGAIELRLGDLIEIRGEQDHDPGHDDHEQQHADDDRSPLVQPAQQRPERP